MKKFFIILFILTTFVAFSYVYFRTSDVLLYPNRKVYFSTDETFHVQVFYSDITRGTLNGYITISNSSDFTLIHEKNELYSITLPDMPGAYYVVINGDKKTARNIFFITQFEAFVASDGNNLFFSVYDLKNKKFVDKLNYYDGYVKKTISGPIFSFDIEYYKGKAFFLDNNVVFLSNYGSYSKYPERKAIVFTDKPIYKPGDTLNFRVNLFKKEKDRYIPYQSSATVSLKDPFNNIIYSNSFNTDEYGGFSFDYKTTNEIITGNYTLIILENDETISWYNFLIQDYTKPTYSLTLTPAATQLIAGNTLRVKLKATYLNGDPVKNASVLFYSFRYSNLINKIKAKTDENGEAIYDVYLEEAGIYRIQALVSDDSGRQYEKNAYVEVKADNVVINGTLKNSTLKLFITDLKGKPLNGIALITLNEETTYVEVLNGKAEIELPKNLWYVKVNFGKEEKVIYKSYSRSEKGIIIVDKLEAKIGELVNVQVDPKEDFGVLIFGSEKINDFKIINRKENFSFTIPEDTLSSTYFITFYGFENRDEVKINIIHDRVRKLKIELDKEIYKPGESVNIKFEDSNSLKVVSVADEGLFLLSKRNSIIDELYPKIYYPQFKVYKSSKYIYFDYLTQFENLKESHVFSSTKESEDKNIREYFPETAYWNPSLFENEISLKAPDSITKWRISAYEISKDYIAEGTATFVVTKPFEVKIFVPEFLTANDEVFGTLYIKNYTGKVGKVDVSLQTNNGTVSFEKGTFIIERDLKIPFVLKVFKEGTIEIVAEASMEDEYDGIKLTIPVNPIYIGKNESKIVKINGEKKFSKDTQITVIENLKDFLKPSILALVKYPYGCVEQTMSSFYPALVVRNLVEYEKLDDVILKGLHRLLKFQHNDGGWGWWTWDESDVFMTSYVLEGLYYAKKYGYYFPESVINNGIKYLQNQKINGYAAFVLNLYGIKKDFEVESILDYVFTSPEKIKEIAAESENTAYIPGKGFYSSTYLTSNAIRTLVNANKYPELVDKMVNYLINSRRGFFWYSTKDTAFAILAILESNKFNDFKSNISIEENENEIIVKGNGFIEVKSTEKLFKQNVFNGITLKSDTYKRHEALFEDKYIDVFLPLDTKYVPLNISILDSTPTYSTKIPDEIQNILVDGTPLSFENNKLVIQGPFKFIGNDYYFDEDAYYKIQFKANNDFSISKGDFLKTSITIDGTGEYLIVEEYLPSCAQVVKSYYEKNPDYYGKFSYRWYSNQEIWYSYRDIRKDKVAFFIRYLRPGKLDYYWRTTFNGTFIKRPTYVYNMYYEDTFAFGPLDTIIIK
ncbi:MAG: alpha-2-macroglobulin [Thermosipho sp. (in: Bacteria)]|nr:alpha-2-macroglobulin [Thermosipho sp. (in: thermotogales)]